MHRDALVGLLDALALDDVTLVCQDWGGLLGLRIAGELPDRFARLVVMNTALPEGDVPPGPGFTAWRAFAASTPDLPIGAIFERTIADPTRRTPEILAGYEAPFPDATFKVGAQAFPLLVPIAPDDPGAAENRRAWQTLERWEKPSLILWGPLDPVLGIEAARAFERRIPGAGPVEIVDGAGHFLQEDRGEAIAERVGAFLAATPLSR
jgi:haloalkane dehalogenase